MPHIALLGPPQLLERCAPTGVAGLDITPIDGLPTAGLRADAIVAFEPSERESTELGELALPTLLWWEDAPPPWAIGAPGSHDPRRTIAGGSKARSGTWRSVALPVADELFADLPGQSADTASRVAVAVNFRDENGPASVHRALVALARGDLLVSEPLEPSRGLEPGIDYLEARHPDEVASAVENVVRAPDAYLRMRLRGRRKAELFRSSRVLARLVGDLLLELDVIPAGR